MVTMHVDLHKHGLDQVAAVENADKTVLLVVPDNGLGNFYA